jgi:polysaccharide biosynthesis transport protein
MATHLETNDPADTLETAQPSGVGPFRVAWRHRPLLALGLVVGLVLGTLYFMQAKPLYQSGAAVLVVRNAPPVPSNEAQPAYNEDYLSTQQSLIRSFEVVNRAVKKGKLAELETLKESLDPVKDIQEMIKISQELNNSKPTNILNIAYRSYNPDDAKAVVEATIASYQEFLTKLYFSRNKETQDLISKANEDFAGKLSKARENYADFTSEHPNLWKGKDGISATQERMFTLEARRSLLLLQQSELQGKKDAFEKAVKDGKHTRPELIAMMVAQKAQRPASEMPSTTAAIEERLLVLEMKEKDLQETFGNKHPEVKSTHNQIAALQTLLDKRGGNRDSTADSMDPIKSHILSLELDVENARMASKAIEEFIQDEKTKVAKNHSIEQRGEALRKEVDNYNSQLEGFKKRLDDVSVLKDYAGNIEATTIAPAQVGYKVHPKLVIVFLVASVLGLLAGFGLAYLAELADQSFRTPEEIRRLLGLPVVGHIPFFGPDEAPAEGALEPAMGPTLCTIHRPKSRESEAYRGVRTAIFFSNRTEGVKVIQVTSPDMADGKSTLAANLVVSIAQSGKKVVIVDADFRRPRLHKMFNVSGKVGLASVILGEAELKDVIQPTTIPGLFILPCGPIPPNPAELLTVNRFAEILTEIREQFDFVVIDTPPLLAVTDPCVVVPHVDGVILTVRISKNARPHASRAKEILTTLGAHVLGVVVNAVGRDAQGYGYDNYRYGYTYRYTDYYYNYEQTAPAEGDANAPNKTGQPSRRRHSANKKKGGLLAWLLNH